MLPRFAVDVLSNTAASDAVGAPFDQFPAALKLLLVAPVHVVCANTEAVDAETRSPTERMSLG